METRMPKILAALLLSLAAMVVHAQDRTQVFSATTSGDLLIDADGRVAELDLHRKQLGDEVMAAIELRIREWRFQPVQVDGRPTPIRVRLQLDMLALREPGATGVTLAIRGVRFFDERIPVAVSGAGA